MAKSSPARSSSATEVISLHCIEAGADLDTGQRLRQWVAVFSEVGDPRREQGKRYNLGEMILMALMAVLSGADGWIAVERFCGSQRQWLQRYLTLRSGIPTHDTFERVLAVLDSKTLSPGFGQSLQLRAR